MHGAIMSKMAAVAARRGVRLYHSTVRPSSCVVSYSRASSRILGNGVGAVTGSLTRFASGVRNSSATTGNTTTDGSSEWTASEISLATLLAAGTTAAFITGGRLATAKRSTKSTKDSRTNAVATERVVGGGVMDVGLQETAEHYAYPGAFRYSVSEGSKNESYSFVCEQ